MKLLFLSLFLIAGITVSAQKSVDELINEGIELHDKDEYDAALAKYDAALQLDPGSQLALFEKSYTLLQLKRYKEAEEILARVLKESKDPKIRKLAFVQYGTVFDYQGEGKKSVKVYNEGLKEFPDYYLLAFNKGVTQLGIEDREGALESFKQSVKANPLHASSHSALSDLAGSNRIPAILSEFTFLMIEPQGKRAEATLVQLNKMLMRGIEKKDDKNVTINIDMSALDNKNKSKDDDFSSAELMLSLLGASNEVADSLGAKTEAERLSYKFQMLIGLISEKEKKKDKGFYKNFYVPMFVEMKEKGFVSTASYIVLASTPDQQIQEWLEKNSDKVEAFYAWFKSYQWVR